MKLFHLAIFTATILSLTITGKTTFADPLNPKTVPKQSDWYFHVNLDQLAQGAIAELMSDFDFMVLFETGKESGLKYFTDDNGKVKGGITSFGTGAEPTNAVIRATGINDMESVISNLETSESYQSSEKNGYTIHSWTEKKGNGSKATIYGTFTDDTTFLASQSTTTLFNTLDFLNSNQPSIKLSGKSNAAILAKANLAAIKTKSRIAGKAKSMQAQMNVSPDGSMTGTVQLETADADTAQKMHSMLEGVLALASVYVEPGEWNPGESVKSKLVGNTVSIDLTMPVSMLNKLRNMK